MKRDTFLVALGLFVVGYGTNVSTPFLVLYRDRLDLSANATQLIFVVYVVGILSTLMLAGQLSDRYGRRRLLIASLALSALGSAVLIAGRDSFVLLMMGRVILGVVSGLGLGVGAAWLQELMGPAQQHKAALVATLVTYGGFGAAPPLSVLYEWLGPSPLIVPFVFHIVLTLAIIPAVASVHETVDVAAEAARGPWRPAIRFGIPATARRQFLWYIGPLAILIFAFSIDGLCLVPGPTERHRRRQPGGSNRPVWHVHCVGRAAVAATDQPDPHPGRYGVGSCNRHSRLRVGNHRLCHRQLAARVASSDRARRCEWSHLDCRPHIGRSTHRPEQPGCAQFHVLPAGLCRYDHAARGEFIGSFLWDNNSSGRDHLCRRTARSDRTVASPARNVVDSAPESGRNGPGAQENASRTDTRSAMTLRARRLFLPFLLVGLIAAGCSSSDGETTTAAALAIEEPDTSDATEQDRDNKDRDRPGR